MRSDSVLLPAKAGLHAADAFVLRKQGREVSHGRAAEVCAGRWRLLTGTRCSRRTSKLRGEGRRKHGSAAGVWVGCRWAGSKGRTARTGSRPTRPAARGVRRQGRPRKRRWRGRRGEAHDGAGDLDERQADGGLPVLWSCERGGTRSATGRQEGGGRERAPFSTRLFIVSRSLVLRPT